MTPSASKRRSFRPRLETVILACLGLKLALVGVVLMSFSGDFRPFAVPVALAAEPAPAQTPAQATSASTPAPTASPDNASPESYRAMQLVLDRRKLQLDEREQALKEREDALKTVEKETKERVARLTDQLTELIRQKEALLQREATLMTERQKQLDAQKQVEDARISHLAKAYGAMRPESAGQLVNSLDDDVAVRILSVMNSRAAGQIMSFVTPDKAARLTKKLALEEKGPGPAAAAK